MNHRIVIIDDDLSFAKTIVRHLTRLEMKIEIDILDTIDKVEGYFQAIQPEIVILDLNLNNQGAESGFQVLSSIKKRYPTIRIIVVSGHIHGHIQDRAMEEGAAIVFNKPINSKILRSYCSDILRVTELENVTRYTDCNQLAEISLKDRIKIVESSIISTALEKNINGLDEVCRELQVTRITLWRKMKEYNLKISTDGNK